MLRGTKKQIIHLKHPDNPLFEEAFLIVKHDPSAASPARSMVEEANRLLAEPYKQEITPAPAPRRHGVRWALLCFLFGAISSAAILTLCILI